MADSFILLQSGFSIYCDDAGGKENQPAKPVPGKLAPTLVARPASVLVMRPSPAFEVRPAPALPPALPRLPILEKENTLPALMLKVTWRFPFSRYGFSRIQSGSETLVGGIVSMHWVPQHS